MYGRRHFKVFTNCHVSLDTLYFLLSNTQGTLDPLFKKIVNCRFY